MVLAAPRSEANEVDLALLIADLSGYTALTEAHGAFRAAEIIDRFERIAEGCREPGVAIVERVGDEILFSGLNTLAILRTAMRLREEVARAPEFPGVRAAIHRGPLVERDGKLFGAPLNLTARIAANARGGQILCTEPVARWARTLAGVEARALGEKRFKNVSFPVILFDLVQSAAGTPAAIDPVCRMQVHLRSDHLKVEHAGTTYVFCSHECAQAFNEAPGRFVGIDEDKAW